MAAAPIELTPGKEKWQRKAQLVALTFEIEGNKFDCHCWDCLRKVGITPSKNSPPQHRSTVIVGKLYRTDNGLAGRVKND